MLKAKGYLPNLNKSKKTKERNLIFERIRELKNHFDAESLYELLKLAGQKISRATVYRSLQLFLQQGIIKEATSSNRKIYYEFSLGKKHHDHLICLGCGKIIEFYNAKIEALQSAICRQNNFQSCEHLMVIRGYCRKCKTAFKESG